MFCVSKAMDGRMLRMLAGEVMKLGMVTEGGW
jgi:hypothetical protein